MHVVEISSHNVLEIKFEYICTSLLTRIIDVLEQ